MPTSSDTTDPRATSSTTTATPADRAVKRRRRAVVTAERRPARAGWDALWDMYYEAFEPLQELALLNHLYPRDDFEALLDDERIIKIVARADGDPVGLAMVTNELSIVPQISPPFLHRRYPEAAARSAVFFGIMVFVAESHARSTVFPRLVAGMGQVTAEQSGVIVFDICRHNLEALDLDRQIETIAHWFPGATFDVIDQQSYFGAHLPALPERRLPISPLPATVDGEPSTAPRSVVEPASYALAR